MTKELDGRGETALSGSTLNTVVNAVRAGIIDRSRVLELSSVFSNDFPSSEEGRIFVNPIGMGCEDIYIASKILHFLNGYSGVHTFKKIQARSRLKQA